MDMLKVYWTASMSTYHVVNSTANYEKLRVLGLRAYENKCSSRRVGLLTENTLWMALGGLMAAHGDFLSHWPGGRDHHQELVGLFDVLVRLFIEAYCYCRYSFQMVPQFKTLRWLRLFFTFEHGPAIIHFCGLYRPRCDNYGNLDHILRCMNRASASKQHIWCAKGVRRWRP